MIQIFDLGGLLWEIVRWGTFLLAVSALSFINISSKIYCNEYNK